MERINNEQMLYIEQNIRNSQEIRKLRAEIDRLSNNCKTLQKTLNAVIAAFFKTGATAPNVTQDCWEAGKTYQIVQNDDFFTISRSDEEAKREREYEDFMKFLRNSRRYK